MDGIKLCIELDDIDGAPDEVMVGAADVEVMVGAFVGTVDPVSSAPATTTVKG